MEDASYELRLQEWLRDSCGIADRRRLVRRDATKVLVSKFDEGFAARLHDALARVPELTDQSIVHAAYAKRAAADPGQTRTAAWHDAMLALVASLAEERGLDRDQLAEIGAGIDSVAALLDSVLWSQPRAGEEFVPSDAERLAYTEASDRMNANPGIFTRFYGVFEGARVENHCPGAQLARALLEDAWATVAQTVSRDQLTG